VRGIDADPRRSAIMPAMPKSDPRRRSSYEIVQEQLADLNEARIAANIATIKGTIGIYERIYGMSSDEMREKLAAGVIEETNEICAWSQLVSVHELILNDEN
jgi:hypothetical protein